MAGRGRGRGRGFGRGKPFPSSDQLNPLPADKVPSVQLSPYPPLEFFPAQLSTQKDYDDLLLIRDQLLIDFQSSKYHLKQEDENLKLFSSGGEKVAQRKPPLDFHWDYFPLELRPVAKQKQKKAENQRQKTTDSFDLSWLDKLEKKEADTPPDEAIEVDKNIKKESKADGEEEEEAEGETEEFEDEELDLDTDYMMSYFDDGEDYMDDNNDADQEPYF